MIKEYNQKSLYFGVPGLILQIGGRFMTELIGQQMGIIISLVGTILLLTGFAFYAKAKGRLPA